MWKSTLVATSPPSVATNLPLVATEQRMVATDPDFVATSDKRPADVLNVTLYGFSIVGKVACMLIHHGRYMIVGIATYHKSKCYIKSIIRIRATFMCFLKFVTFICCGNQVSLLGIALGWSGSRFGFFFLPGGGDREVPYPPRYQEEQKWTTTKVVAFRPKRKRRLLAE